MRISDWSSDVWSSDLLLDRIGEGHTDDEPGARAAEILSRLIPVHRALDLTEALAQRLLVLGNDRQRLRQEDDQQEGTAQKPHRSEERREGEEGVRTCRSRGSP